LKCKKNGFSDIQIGFEDTGAVNPSTGKKFWKLVDPGTMREHQHKSRQGWTYKELKELREEMLEIDRQRIEYLYLLFRPPEEYLPKKQQQVEVE
jgi:hypothetical protein